MKRTRIPARRRNSMAYSISDGDARSSDPDESQSEEEQELAQDSPSNRRRLRNPQFEAM